jgi:tetratricopeptide (TPR) repeat protein
MLLSRTSCDAILEQPVAISRRALAPVSLRSFALRLMHSRPRCERRKTVHRSSLPFFFVSLVFAAALGCQSKTPDASDHSNATSQGEALASNAKQENPIERAEKLLASGDAEAAVNAIRLHLMQSPEDRGALLVAAKAEATLGNAKAAIDLLQSIPANQSVIGREAMGLRIEQARKIRDDAVLENALRDWVNLSKSSNDAHRQLIEHLNRHGRRQEACEVAMKRCREGTASDWELHNLIRRSDAFPFEISPTTQPSDVFSAGPGMARWWFTHKQYNFAIEELDAWFETHGDATQTPTGIAATALLGRLLAETQSSQRFDAWFDSLSPAVKNHGDYWSAIGLTMIQAGEHEGAARALMESLLIDPTDARNLQRLGQTMDALQQDDLGQQYRDHGILLAQLQRLQEKLLQQPDDRALITQISTSLLELARPFEAIAWASLAVPSGAAGQRAALKAKRESFLANPDLDQMIRDDVLRGESLADYRIDPAIQRVLGDDLSTATKLLQVPQASEIAATVKLVNVASERGLNFQWVNQPDRDLSSIPIYQSLGGGIGVLDFDLDGWPDVYFAQGGGLPPGFETVHSDQMFRNLQGTFREVTKLSGTGDQPYGSGLTGYGTGIAAGDINQDGFADLFVANLGMNQLLMNNGDGTFTDSTQRLNESEPRFTSSLAIADINDDALPDLYEANYIKMDGGFERPKLQADGREAQPSPLLHHAEFDRWYIAQGDGNFESHEIGKDTVLAGTGLGVIVTDFDVRHPGNEVFIGNDVRANHYLFQSGDDQFRNLAGPRGNANGYDGAANGCMGIAAGDFNRDGTLDLQIANFHNESANLYLQNSEGGFVDAAVKYQLDQHTKPYVGFGTKAVDFDRNGWQDFFTSNGHIFDMSYLGEGFQMVPQLLMGQGDRYTPVQPDGEYFAGKYLGRAVALLDFDQDRAIDVLVSHLDQPAALLHNQTRAKGSWIQIELIGTKSERDAIGASIMVVTTDDQAFAAWVTAGDGYLATDESVIDVGLAQSPGIDRIEIRWPSGTMQVIQGVKPGQRYLVVENQEDYFGR